jgi:hypothetical protein
LDELAVHNLAIDKPSARKATTPKSAIRELAIDKVALGKQAPIPIYSLE